MSNGLDCLAIDCGRSEPLPARAPRSYAGVDLMAKDFDSLLRAMLDQLQRLAPDWRDRSEADFGMVLMELFAYAGDQLSYLQDRVALEGFLRTATQAESVRKLLRLVDYTIDPGFAASTQMLVECVGTAPLFLPAGFAITTRGVAGVEPLVYETSEDAVLFEALSVIALAIDAPSSSDGKEAVLQADLTGVLSPGAWLLFQQGDAREWARVALCTFAATTTSVTLTEPLSGTYTTAGSPAASVHGNRVRATHGESHVENEHGNGLPGQSVSLELAPLTWVFDEERQRAVSTLTVAVDDETWVEVEDFIDSEATSLHYRVSRDNAGFLTIHFGDGEFGAAPELDSTIVVRYRVGIGSSGHVARETLIEFDRSLQFPDPSQHITRVRNPLPADAPRDPQTLQQAKLLGPANLRIQDRAVIPVDFEQVLAGGVRVSGQLVRPLQSQARIRNTGSWNTAVVSVDMPDRSPLSPGLRNAFESALSAKKMAGIDVQVEDARYCPVHIALLVDVDAEHFARDVRDAVEHALVGPFVQGVPFFGPGRFRFGQDVFLSDLYAVVTAVDGVRSVAVTRFKRLGDGYPDSEANGFIPVGALEVARCDNDAAARENGLLFVRTCGGKEG